MGGFILRKLFQKLKFNNVKVGSKYGIIVGFVLTLFVISAVVVWFFLQNINNDIEALERRGDRAMNVTEMGSLLRAKAVRVFQYVDNPSADLEEEYTSRSSQFSELKNQLEPKMTTDEEIALFNEIVDLEQQMNRNFNEVVTYMGQGEMGSADVVAENAHKAQSDAVTTLEELKTLVNEQRANAIEQAKRSETIAVIALIVAIAVSLVLSILLITIVNRIISRNLQNVVDVSNQIAEGNLQTEQITYNGNDEIGQLADSVNTMSGSLRSILTSLAEVSDTVSAQSEELNQSAGEVKSGTDQIATTMQELASGSETQANNASDVSTKMSDFTNKVTEATNKGEQIENNSSNVLDLTNDGKEMMDTSITQMNRVHSIVKDSVEKVRGLDSQTQEISKLVSVINDIAEQTNLLALNAAIESARAGEHGKGFAVVADEVRKLAEQVSDSVSDITGIVDTIQQESSTVTESLENGYNEVEQGTNQIKQTGTTFEQINDAVNDMVSSIQSVTTNLQQMSTNSQEINASVEEIASISEESAAGVEQTSASAQQASSSMEEVSSSSNELAKLAEQLNTLVRQFKI
ncbi:methyl-accepting chemotaxis protein [Gracilibacillus halophilus]|uniref:methyl-accepting chemotaxis protein n=1 Tax=Gracilibacillus halophilus TaxID=470864 RepID=UPI00058C9C5E|nr:methyl-accepting chemotaxis protein [Gracilibacillus halophilus]